MENMTFYSLYEIIALSVAVVMGTGAYIGFVYIRKCKGFSYKAVISIFFINLFITFIFSEALKLFKWGEYRTVVLPLVAYAGQYLLDWLDRRYLNLFDSAAKKAGLDLNTEAPQEPENYDNNYEKDTENN